MATDREAKLRLKAELTGMDKAAADTAAFVEEVTQAGAIGKEAAGELTTVAEATDQVAAAQKRASEAGQQEAATVKEVAQAAHTEAAAMTEAGTAAVNAGRSTSESYAAVRAAQQEAIAAWRANTVAAEESGTISVAATRALVESFQAQTTAIRASGGALEAQRAELQTIVTALQEITTENANAGSATKEQADIAGAALLEVKAALASVNDEIRTEITNLRDAGTVAQESLATVVEQLSVQIEAIRNGNSAYGVQREELSAIQKQLQEVLSASVAAGEAESEQAQAAGKAIAQVRSALAEVNAELAREAQAWSALRSAGTEALQPTVAALLGEADAVQRATKNLEVQRATLVEVQQQLKIMLDEQIAAGQAGSEASNLIGIALTDVKGRINEVTAAMKAQGEASAAATNESRNSLENLRGETLTVQEATEIAASKIRAAWELYNEELKITPRSVGFVVQAVEGLRMTIDATRGTTQEATTQEIADYERLRAELAKLQVQARLVLDEQQDARLLLKESGNQIQSVGIAVQQLSSSLGPMGQAFGSAAGQAALFSGGLQQVRDAFKQMNLNQLEFNGLNATTITQGGLIAGTFIAAAIAGLKLAETNKTNEDTVNQLKKSWTNLGVEVSERMDGVQEEIDKSDGSLLDFFAHLGSGTAEASVSLAAFADRITEINIARVAGITGVRVYNEALAAGIEQEKAEAFALAITTEQIKIHTEAEAKGIIGKQLWNDAIKASGGNMDAFNQKIGELKARLDLLADSYAHLQKATNGSSSEIVTQTLAMQRYIPEADRYSVVLKQQADNLQKMLDNTIGLTKVERERIQSIIDLAQHGETLNAKQKELLASLIASTAAGKAASDQTKGLTADLQREADALTGTAAALARRLDRINALLPASQKHSIELKTIAAELQDELNKTDKLSEKERERIQVIIEMIAKGDALTASEKVLIQYLIQHALAHDRVAESARAQLNAETALTGAVDQLAQAIKDETGAHAENQTAIGKAVEAAQALLKSSTTLTSAERERIRQMIDLGKEIDADNARLKGMTATTQAAATATQQHAQATENVYSVVRASAKTIQEDIEGKKTLFDLLQKLNTKTDESAKSTEALTVSYVNGQKVISNVKDSVVQLVGSLKDGDASISNADKSTVTFTGNLQEGTAAIVSQGEAVRASTQAVADNAQGVTTQINGAADAMKGHADAAKAAADLLFTGYTQANTGATTLKETILGMDEVIVRANDHIVTMADNLRKLAEQAAATAVGGGGANGAGENPYPGVTEGP